MASVLIVEDEAQVRVLAEDILQQHGHTTKTAANALEARALLNNGEPFDVLFTDIDLGDEGPSGLHVAREAAELRRGIKVIYATGESVTDGMRELQVDGSMLISKPYVSADFMSALETLLAS